MSRLAHQLAARAGAAGAVVALVEPGQVVHLDQIYDTAGVTSVSHRVEPGHVAVRELAESGTPIPPAQIRAHQAGWPSLTGLTSDRPVKVRVVLSYNDAGARLRLPLETLAAHHRSSSRCASRSSA